MTDTWEEKFARLIATPRPELGIDLLTDPDARDAEQQAEADLDQARRRLALGGDDPATELVTAVGEAEAALEQATTARVTATVTLHFRALPAWAWEQLLADHPGPKGMRFAPRTFMPAAIAACLVDGDAKVEQIEILFGYLHAAALNRIFAAVWELNTGERVRST